MSVPASKKSRSAVRRRRSHMSVDPVDLSACENCKSPVKSHFACGSCGHYKGRQAIDHSRDAKREIKKIQARATQEQETPESAE